MKRLDEFLYCQKYYSTNFFTLDEVKEYETERLWSHAVEVTDYEFEIGNKDGHLIFYLTLYFESLNGTQLTSRELFNHNNHG